MISHVLIYVSLRDDAVWNACIRTYVYDDAIRKYRKRMCHQFVYGKKSVHWEHDDTNVLLSVCAIHL